jgi:hypothetical protein
MSSVLSRMNGSEPPSSSTTFFRFRPATLGNRRPGALRPGHGYALHARVGDHPRDLIVGGVDVDVCALREAGVQVDLLQRRCRLRALGRMLQQHGVADDQVRPAKRAT